MPAAAAPAVSPSARSLAIQTCVSTREPVQVGRSQPASTLEQQQGGSQHRHERADAKKEIGFQRLYVVNHSIECSSQVAGQKVIGKKTAEMIVKRFMTCDCVRLADGSFLTSMQGKEHGKNTLSSYPLSHTLNVYSFPAATSLRPSSGMVPPTPRMDA